MGLTVAILIVPIEDPISWDGVIGQHAHLPPLPDMQDDLQGRISRVLSNSAFIRLWRNWNGTGGHPPPRRS